MTRFDHLRDLDAAVGTHLGHGDWLVIDQERIDRFAEATGDDQWIHVDPVRAADGPYGGTIAHGYLTLSLLPILTTGVFEPPVLSMEINYGLNKVRFPSAVVAGSRVRASVELAGVAHGERGTQATLAITVEVEGSSRPAVVAEWVLLLVP